MVVSGAVGRVGPATCPAVFDNPFVVPSRCDKPKDSATLQRAVGRVTAGKDRHQFQRQPAIVRAFFMKPREPIVHFKIKIKTAAGVQHLDGIFSNKWAAVVAGMEALGDAEGNVVATQVLP